MILSSTTPTEMLQAQGSTRRWSRRTAGFGSVATGCTGCGYELTRHGSGAAVVEDFFQKLADRMK
jgi:hypothetical protein